MAKPYEKLADSLTILRALQMDGRRVFQSEELTRTHRERLVNMGFLQEVVKGWLISCSPDTKEGEWYASFWEFCARYCNQRFQEDWYLSPEQSLLLHAEKTSIPSQVIVYSPKGNNHKMALPFGTSLFDLKQRQPTPAAELTVRDGLRIFTPEAALARVSESFIAKNPIETRVVLASLRDAESLLRILLDGGFSVVAGRLAGALRRIGRPESAAEILTAMKAAGYRIRPTDPFRANPAPVLRTARTAPIAGRMRAMWESMRAKVLEVFPPAPGGTVDRASYLRSIDEIYRSDAYHSLSIEGYKVSPELIERVRAGNWDPANHEADWQSGSHQCDALAARGYWQAFEAVKGSIAEILYGIAPGTRAGGEQAGRIVRAAHREWYRELFQPCVIGGLIAPSALAGYRNDAVYLRTSRYVPPRWEAVRDAMPALFELLEDEPEPGVRAVLGHWLFGYVHPYPDGNGRMARFLMNAMLASGGYPWTVIRVDDRDAYLAALDSASLDADIEPFALFIGDRVNFLMQERSPVHP